MRLYAVMMMVAVAMVTAPATILALVLLVAFVADQLFREQPVNLLRGYPRLRRGLQALAVFAFLGVLALGTGYGRVALGGSEGKPSERVSFAPYGKGYETHSWLGNGVLGRQYVRRDVRRVMTAAFADRGDAGRVHLLADTGTRDGEQLSGHGTHTGGRYVDVHFPMTRDGEPALLPSNLLTLWGYLWRFDDTGEAKALAFDKKSKKEAGCKRAPQWGVVVPAPLDYRIDLDELAHLIAAVHDAAKAEKTVRLKKILVWPPLQKALKKTPAWRSLFGKGKRRVSHLFNRRCVWVLHDEHVHFEFASR